MPSPSSSLTISVRRADMDIADSKLLMDTCSSPRSCCSSTACDECSTPRTPPCRTGEGLRSWTPPPRPTKTSMTAAIRSHDLELVKSAIEDDLNSVHVPCLTPAGCETPILQAVRCGCSAAIVGCLLQSGASVDDVDSAGRTALEVLCAAASDSEGAAGEPSADLDDILGLHGLSFSPVTDWTIPPPTVWNIPPPIHGDIPLLHACRQAIHPPCVGGDPCSEGDGVSRQRLSCARLLLAHGAGSRPGAAEAAAAVAEANGNVKLASLVRQWKDLQACRWLREQRSRLAAAAHGSKLSLLGCPEGVFELICERLAPEDDIVSGQA